MTSQKYSVFIAIALLSCGCVSTAPQNPVVISEAAKEEARQAYEFVRSKGAAIVVRVAVDGEECLVSSVTLRKVVSGIIDQNTFTVVGQVGTIDNEKAVSELPNTAFDKKAFFDALSFGGPEPASSIRGNLSTYDSRISFRPVSPGRYVITDIYCAIGRKRYTLGADIFGMPRKYIYRPLPGDNTIEIGQRQIVDAGVLDIVNTGKMIHFLWQAGTLISHETAHDQRDILRSNMPDLASKIIYKKFSPSPMGN